MIPLHLFTRALTAGDAAYPLYVVFFVTDRCTARCAHCLLGHEVCTQRELSLDEIQRWAKNMPEFYFLLPTGGEPFLRPDLPDIVRLFVQHCRVRNAGIPTNGSLTDNVVVSVERILTENPALDLAVDVSFDGTRELHDSIRGVDGLFDKAVATYRALEKIARGNRRFNLDVAVTVSALNQDRLDELLDFLVGDLGVKNINHLLVRGRPRDPAALEVDPEQYKRFNRRLEGYMNNGTLRGYTGYGEAAGINALKLVRQRAIERTVESGRRQVMCRAGRQGAVVKPDGRVFPCELLDRPMGSLRDADFDFKKIWRSKQARGVRRYIQDSKCFCTYECFMTLNVLYDPEQAARIAVRWAQLRAQKSGIGGGRV